MNDYREIVTKAVISKGKRLFTNSYSVDVENPTNILGCWIINHTYSGNRSGNDVNITGKFDVNIWYSSDNDTKTEVIKETIEYNEVIHMRENGNYENLEVIVRCLKQPSCVKAELKENSISYTIEKELGIELVGDIKVKIDVRSEPDVWDEIVEDNSSDNIDKVEENFIKEVVI